MSELLLKAQNLKLDRSGRDLFSGIGEVCIFSGKNLLVLGPSGCGKTSLLHILTGLLPADGGTVEFLGKNYSHISSAALNRLRGQRYGVIHQKLHLISHLSVYQNISLAFKGARKPVNKPMILKVLEELGLRERAFHCARTLSQGEAQRVAIARAVVHKPDIIFADEPTSSLDDRHTDAVCGLLMSLSERGGASLVISTHDQRVRDVFKGQVLEMQT
ncbi:MAG: ATP-binding cassette domain-containing protein [Alphaproteobacteria bacterium]|nr:ATP-binding cassette domain-containing protein [Alphaproteobacteria bacterium]